VAGSAGTATASSGAFPLTVTSGEKLGLALDVQYPERYHASGHSISAVNLACPKRARRYRTAGSIQLAGASSAFQAVNEQVQAAIAGQLKAGDVQVALLRRAAADGDLQPDVQ